MDTRKCFARGISGSCTILMSPYMRDGACKFCKPDRDVTDGVKYPFDIEYGKPKKLLIGMRVIGDRS